MRPIVGVTADHAVVEEDVRGGCGGEVEKEMLGVVHAAEIGGSAEEEGGECRRSEKRSGDKEAMNLVEMAESAAGQEVGDLLMERHGGGGTHLDHAGGGSAGTNASTSWVGHLGRVSLPWGSAVRLWAECSLRVDSRGN